ncbi:MAG: PD-(D/E)XK nuclease family protein [Methylococcaceae bacterium]
MNIAEIKNLLETEVTVILQESPSFKNWLEQFIYNRTVSPESFDARFERYLKEWAAQREAQSQQWSELREEWRRQREIDQARFDAHIQDQSKNWQEEGQRWREQHAKDMEQIRIQEEKWNEQSQRWNEQSQRWGEQSRKWDEQSQRWGEQSQRWDEQRDRDREHARLEEEKWKEQNRRWEANAEEMRALRSKHDQSIGALGARWGIASEQSFRSALSSILMQSFGVNVLNINEYDDQGIVFGRPDQVELDIIIQNGTLIIIELKSSMSKSEMYIFDRKCTYYEARHQRSPDRKIVVSPMVDAKAQEVAKRLGIEVFTFAEDVSQLN